jgi:hypothetical protein
MRQGLRGEVAAGHFETGVFGAKKPDDPSGETARRGIFAEHARVDV